MHPVLDWPGPLAFAHRGGASEHPENTMAAFQHAVDLGFTYLETDVHATADGVLVAFHDPDLSRTCSVDGLISELPYSEVAAARVHGVAPIPLLDELVETFPHCRFSIDCKADSAVDALAAAMRRHNLFDRVTLGSFSDRRLRRLRALLGERVCTSSGPAETAVWRSTGRLVMSQFASVPTHAGKVPVVTEQSVARSHAHGNPVVVWTIDDPAEMHRLLDLGVDGLMTDVPATLKSVYEERGVWV